MPAFTTILAATALATNTGMAINKSIKAKRAADKYEDQIKNYQREDFTNAYAGISVPMEGFRLREESIERNVASASGSLADAGARGVVGGIQSVLDYSDRGLAQIGADIEKSKTQLNTMIAEDEKRLQGETARREDQDLNGLGSLYAASKAESQSAIDSIPETIGAVGSLFGDVDPEIQAANKADRAAKKTIRQDARKARKADRLASNGSNPTATFEDLLA